MAPLFLSLLRISINGSIAVCAVLILRLLLGSAPKAWTCFLWLLCGLRLTLPFSLQSGLSLQPKMALVSQLERITVTASRGTDISRLACWIWLLGICLLAAATGISYLRLRLRVRGAIVRPDGCRESDKLDTACVLGFFVPRIYLPQGLDPQQRQLILSHERAHIARGDHLLKVLGFCVLTLHWFNPLIWLAYPLFCQDIEFACDERVVRGMDLNRRKAYSTALVTCSVRRASSYAVHFAESGVKDRVLRVLRYRKPTLTKQMVCAVAAVFLAVCFLTSPLQLLTAGFTDGGGITLGDPMQKQGSFPEPFSQEEPSPEAPAAESQPDPAPQSPVQPQNPPASADGGSFSGPTGTAGSPGTSGTHTPLNKQNLEKVPKP